MTTKPRKINSEGIEIQESSTPTPYVHNFAWETYWLSTGNIIHRCVVPGWARTPEAIERLKTLGYNRVQGDGMVWPAKKLESGKDAVLMCMGDCILVVLDGEGPIAIINSFEEIEQKLIRDEPLNEITELPGMTPQIQEIVMTGMSALDYVFKALDDNLDQYLRLHNTLRAAIDGLDISTEHKVALRTALNMRANFMSPAPANVVLNKLMGDPRNNNSRSSRRGGSFGEHPLAGLLGMLGR